MRPRALSKLVSGFFCSLIFAAWIHHNAVREFSAGREAYLAEQGSRFDRIVAMNARSPLPGIFGAIFVLGFVFIVYELISAFADRFMEKPAQEQSPAPYPGQTL
jgi:hypothetical protein